MTECLQQPTAAEDIKKSNNNHYDRWQLHHRAGVQVFTWLCTAVSCRATCTGRRHHGAPQSALSHSRSTKFPSVQHDKLWPTSIFVHRPSCLELTARTSV